MLLPERRMNCVQSIRAESNLTQSDDIPNPIAADDYQLRSSPRFDLFHGHALGQIARLIDIAAELDCHVIGQQLKWDHAQNRHQAIRDIG